MALFRLAESTELNNAWIVGVLAGAALVVLWLVIAITSSLVRQATKSLRVLELQSFTEGFTKRARLFAVISSFLIVLGGAGALTYALWRSEDLQPIVDEAMARVTRDTVIAVSRTVGVVLLFLLAFYLLRVASQRAIARIRSRMSPKELAARQQVFLERFFLHLPTAINLALAYALLGLASGTFALPAPSSGSC